MLTGAADLPKDGPLPVSRPEETPKVETKQAPDDAAKAEAEAERKAKEEAEKAKQRPQEDDKEQASCRTELKTIGAVFEEAPAVKDGAACGIEKPILLKGLPGGVKVEPEATVRCDTALQLSRWMEGSVKPSLEAAMPGETITGVAQASAYVCKN